MKHTQPDHIPSSFRVVTFLAKWNGRMAILSLLVGAIAPWMYTLSAHTPIASSTVILLAKALVVFGVLSGMIALLVRILILRRNPKIASDYAIEDAAADLVRGPWTTKEGVLVCFVILVGLASQAVALSAGLFAYLLLK